MNSVYQFRHLTMLRMRSPLCCSDDSSVTKLYSFPFSREQHNIDYCAAAAVSTLPPKSTVS